MQMPLEFISAILSIVGILTFPSDVVVPILGISVGVIGAFLFIFGITGLLYHDDEGKSYSAAQ